MEALRKKERQDETQFTTKIGEKTSLGSQLFPFVKFSFPVTHTFDGPIMPKLAVLAPLNHMTLWITLVLVY